MTHDELCELFIDYNMLHLLDMYDDLQNSYSHLDLFNDSKSCDFIHAIVDGLSFVENESDDESLSD